MKYWLGVSGVALLLTAQVAVAQEQEGLATWYGPGFHGRRMANGQVFDMYDPTTTASREYPYGTWLLVTNPQNSKQAYVQVRDRGAFSHALDLSYAAFYTIADPGQMQLRVRYQVVPGPASEPPERPPALAPPGPVPQAAPARTAPAASTARTAASPPASPSAQNPEHYEVRPGDSLVSLGRRFGLGAGDLARLNNLRDPDLLRPGQVLRLRLPAPPAQLEEYVVQPGDLPWAIAQKYNIATTALLELNGMKPGDYIFAGQRLRVPSPERWHTVEPGETLAGIAAHFGTTVEEMLRLNDLSDPDVIHVGASLRVG